MGANVSKKNQTRAQSNKDFDEIAEELGEYATKIGKRGINVIIMKPQKSFATQFLGVHPSSVKKIEKYFKKIGSKMFEFDAYNPQKAIKQLKDILKN